MFDYPQTRHVSVSLKVLIKCHQLFILVDCCYVVVVMLGLLHNTYLKGADCTGEKKSGCGIKYLTSPLGYDMHRGIMIK